MPTAVITFVPDPASNFQFNATFDGQSYSVRVTWNVFGQRYYVNIYTTQGILMLSIAMVGSPPDYDISLTVGIFTTKLVWRVAANQFEVI